MIDGCIVNQKSAGFACYGIETPRASEGERNGLRF